MRTRLSSFLQLLVIIFCVAYPIAVIGLAFNVHLPFLMNWAASVFLILEGVIVTVAWMDEYGPANTALPIIAGNGIEQDQAIQSKAGEEGKEEEEAVKKQALRNEAPVSILV